MRRAAYCDGFFPVNLESPDQLAEIVARIGARREEAGRALDEPYDVNAQAGSARV
jgi:alkanesulfonate monooxygenase SsuD/methylene tetrahydromethanopterin reductase-like flavin-dependent oxidoreductase (luciferase family)